MDLTSLLCNGENGPTFLIVQCLGHHSADALSKTCRSLRRLLVGEASNGGASRTSPANDDANDDGGGHDASSRLWWKSLVLATLQQNNKKMGGGGATTLASNLSAAELVSLPDTSGIKWKDLSDLVHSNLRKRRALACLGLDRQYKYTRPSTTAVDSNLNENLALLMGNNASGNFYMWVQLPYRENAPTGVKRSKRWDWLKPKPQPKTNNPVRIKQHKAGACIVRWTDAELRLLSQAGRFSIGRIASVIEKVVGAIQQETQSVAPLASSGDLGELDPKLHIEGFGDPVRLPLEPEFLDRVVKDDRCRQSSYGQSGGRRVAGSVRACYEMSLGNDVQVTDPTFQKYLSAPSTKEEATTHGMWFAIEERFLPELIGGRGGSAADSSIEQRGYRVTVKPNKMLIYGKGGEFDAHRDSKHGPGHFGTLVVVLPIKTSTLEEDNDDTDSTGGALVLRCEASRCDGTGKQQDSWQTQKHKPPKNSESATWHAFLHGTSHQVLPVKSGYRVALTYQLWLEGDSARLVLPREPNQDLLSLLGRSIQYWVESNSMEELVEFVLPLHYSYRGKDEDMFPPEPLKEASLRGQDSWLFRGILDSLKGTDMKLNLEYNEVCPTLAGYPQGAVTRRGRVVFRSAQIPLEEQSKVIWLHSKSGKQLVDSAPKHKQKERGITVACISISHKRFMCRYGRCRGDFYMRDGYTHPDDVIYTVYEN